MSSPNKFTILIPDVLETADIEESIFDDRFEILIPKVEQAHQIPDEVWARTDAILAFHEVHYPAEVLEKAVNLKVLVRNGVGYDNVDLEAAGRLGIVVCNVPDYGTDSVADHAMALLLTLARRVPVYNEQIRGGDWAHFIPDSPHRLGGTVLGIVGLGRIGVATALRAKAFGMDVRFFDPYVPDGMDKALQITRCDDLHDLLGCSDYVSMHCLLTDETREMANEEFFAAMKPGGIFINTARGGVLDVSALSAALKSNHLLSAAIDVWPNEPPADCELIRDWRARKSWIANRLIATPHVAFYCVESIEEMRIKGAQEVMRVLEGKPPRNCVNPDQLQNPRVGQQILAAVKKRRPL